MQVLKQLHLKHFTVESVVHLLVGLKWEKFNSLDQNSFEKQQIRLYKSEVGFKPQEIDRKVMPTHDADP